MNWTMANRLGHIAATKAHSRLGVDSTRYPINVSKAIDDAGLALMHRPMPRLFGIYIEANGNRGIMVNSIMTRATRRHTAAHELGHHEFQHRPDPARHCAIETNLAAGAESSSTGAQGRVKTQGQVEMTAETFAAWFLMPRRAVIAATAALGMDTVSSPEHAYQLSLMLGTTHRATCRHLANLRLADPDDSGRWARVPPGRLKRALAAEVGLALNSTFDMDVWDLRTSNRARVEASVGDLLVLPADFEVVAEERGLNVVASSASTVTVECAAPTTFTNLMSSRLTVALVVHDRTLGVYLPAADPSLREVELTS